MNRYDLRRLEKAAREKDKKHLQEWAEQFEQQVSLYYTTKCENIYEEQRKVDIDTMFTTLMYVFHFSEEVNIDNDKINAFMDDLMATFHCFSTGEYNPEDFKKQLEEDGLIIDSYQYSNEYTKALERVNKLEKEYLDKLREVDIKLTELDASLNFNKGK